MTRVLLPFPLQRTMADVVGSLLGARTGRLDWRHFPDGESLVTIEQDLDGVDVALVASLRNPDELALPLRFATATAREFGARSVGLIAPYLAYMRQDKRFNPGEAVSALLFARFLAESFDWLVTADPHLHRTPKLTELFRIPAHAVATAPLISDWIRDNVPNAVLIGPDGESSQWVSDIADRAGVAYQILTKIRRGDRDVDVSLPSIDAARSRTPVIVDDIASSGRTMIETLDHLRQLGLPPAVCIVIHPVFAQDAYTHLWAAGAERVVSTDSIPHPSNAISIASLLAEGSAELFGNALPKENCKSWRL
ncbi:ribose-phosphate diphosphokinase [Mesorhizobium sp. M4B.F.Ca.ET.190.01.1.1]|uniref:ribose-phosphate diphosphokinase n=1 Tax=unclassified Mesorhizobium TaxID=325217 RepID=UPI001092A60F|nr:MULTISPECIES: ribose-phosphate diphosphokinase [unclassified Mesorhizobium]TGR08213.1 ribose-phosphate diphosphokinase [Mesorhizobium sp. M4B.F.Ca.ET.200.01.1.1]TGS17570.1 ribose-phosphate diphosphokinase [Mesorhizobium sp. M4B.F.Ca.ET.190.01.1.1]TGT29894.1 ribose-phosphate diphosphokinase [Mesorhizobium sp. M4B.F.Ca.ET.172.01.1.1]